MMFGFGHALMNADDDKTDLKGLVPESWLCVDCGVNTAPGMLNRVELEKAFEADKDAESVQQSINKRCEVYTVRLTNH
jgi:hypothetical protein